MARRKTPTTSDLANPTVAERVSTRDRAISLKKKRDSWEKKQTFEVLRPDSKTTIYRRIPEGKKLKSKSEIHKGTI